MPAVTERDILKRMDKLEGLLEKAAQPRSGGGSPAALFGGYSGHKRDGGGYVDWPVDQLREMGDRLAKAYNHEGAMHLFQQGNTGRLKGIGWGPALVKIATIQNPGKTGYDFGDYSDVNLEKEFGLTSVQKAREIGIKGLNGEVRKTALAEGSGLTGGYVIPPQWQNELLTIAAEDAFVEPWRETIPMTSRTMTIPMLDITTAQAQGTSPYFGGILGTWQPEAATINETEPQFRQTEFTAWDLVLYTVSSNQLLADNGIGLDALLTQLFSQAITWYKEYAFLRGTGAGSSMPQGILGAPATIGVARSGSNAFTVADAAGMMAKLHIRSWDSACWIMHQSLIPKLIQMVHGTTDGNLVWMNPSRASGDAGPFASKFPTAFLNGLPLFFTEKMPQLGTKGDVMLVDFSRYIIGNRMELQIDVSPHYLFRNNQLAWRVCARCDGRPWLNSYITDANGYTSSPFIALNA